MDNYRTVKKHTFINPYNFISIKENPAVSGVQNGNMTGCIEFELTTKSSIHIPNTSSNRAFKYEPTYTIKEGKKTPDDKNTEDEHHGLYDFYSLNQLEPGKEYDEIYYEPRIPGSELRGMIRSIYEALTNSCFSQVNEDTIIGKRTVEHFKQGILTRESGKYKLYQADDCIYRNRRDFTEKYYNKCNIIDGSKVSFKKDRKNLKGEPKKPYEKPDVINLRAYDGKDITGYILKGEVGPEMPSDVEKEKHCIHVFTKKRDKNNNELRPLKECCKSDMDRLCSVIEQYQIENKNAYAQYKETLNKFLNKEPGVDAVPVYYSLIANDLLFLSPACITREVYNNSVSAIIGGYESCSTKIKYKKMEDVKKNVCPACSLFGLISNDFSKGSQLRFTDITLKNQEDYNENYKSCYDENLYVMPELASPKLANTEFYLQKPTDPDGEVWFWTYDYYTVKKADGTVIVKTYMPNISGRKFYLHGNKLAPTEHKTCRNSTVRTVKSGIKFEGKVYFDNITEEQLRQLCFILNHTADGKHGYKIGSGKPNGLGSVCIKIKKVNLRKFDGDKYNIEQYKNKESEHIWKELKFDDTVETQFNLITELLSDDDAKSVHYAGVNNENTDGYTWFVNNKINHRLASFKSDENKTVGGTDRSPRARIQTEIKHHLKTLSDKADLYMND